MDTDDNGKQVGIYRIRQYRPAEFIKDSVGLYF